jgi:hypothetical protein
MRKKELRANQRVGCVELVQGLDAREGVAGLAVRAREAGRLRMLRRLRR